jgi:lysophospholipase L1-like esterase
MRVARLLSALALAALTAPLEAKGQSCAWQPAWAASQYVAEGDNALPPETYKDRTLREIVRTTLAGTALRVRLSNAFGTAPLIIDAASVGRSRDNRSATVESPRVLTFDGARSVTIPAGAEMLSDPVAMATPVLADLAVSIHYGSAPAIQTGHPGSRATSHLAPGNQVDAATLTGATTADRWFNLAAIDVQHCASVPVVVVLGDSITDGRGSTTNGNDRWPDVLARRLNGRAAVINAGIGGNRLLNDGLGPNALARIDRDVLARPGVSHLIVLEGINDLGTATRDAPLDEAGHKALVTRMIGAFKQIVVRAHAHGIKVIGGTIMPFMGFTGYHPDAANEADRQAVNAWIRAPGSFDAVVDLDRVTHDPARPDWLNPAYDVGDHLHPNPAGYKAMGEAVPLDLILR